MNETLHLGKKISRLRELRGMKQETLAEQLGISQQAVSKIEQSQHVEDVTLERIAKVLGVSSEAIKSFNNDSVFFHIENMHDHASANYQCSFNPIDKVVERYDAEIKTLKEEIEYLRKQNTQLLDLAGKKK